MGSWKEDVTLVHISQEQVDADLQCYICLDDLEAGEEVMKLHCAHHYHEQCISPWLDKNTICPTCRQKILRREDPDPEEYEWDFDSGFLTDIIREINNIVYGVDSDEEFLYSDSPDIVDLTGGEGETILLEERNGTGPDTEAEVSEDDVDDDVQPHPQEPVNEVTPLIEVSSDEETEDRQKEEKCTTKRRRSLVEVDDSSDDEVTTYSNTVWLLQDVTKSQQEILASYAQPIKEFPYSVGRNNPVASRKKLRKRQRRSPELDEFQYDQDSSDEDFEFHDTYTTGVNHRNSDEKKQSDKGKENSEESNRSRNNISADESQDDESDGGDFVFDMVEVETLVSKLLEIMSTGEDESNQNEEVEIVESCPEEWINRSVLSKENKGYTKNYKHTDDEIHSSEDSQFHLSYKNSALSNSGESVTKGGYNGNLLVPSERLLVERIPSPPQRKGSKDKSIIINLCSSDSDSCGEDNKESPLKRTKELPVKRTNESPVKRKASSSDSESSNDDDCDGFENIEEIISELWSIVGPDGEESEAEQNDVGNEKICSVKTKQKCLQKKESPKRHKKSYQPTLQGNRN